MGRLMTGCLPRRNERRYYFAWHANGLAQRPVDNRPFGPRANASFPLGTGKLDESLKTSALRRISDPGSGRDHLALMGGSKIIDLVSDHDPIKSVLVRLISHQIPMRYRNTVNPLDPHRIIHVPKLVDVIGAGCKCELECRADHFNCVRMNP